MKSQWKNPKCFRGVGLPAFLIKWLTSKGSFTQKMLQYTSYHEQIEIEVLHEALELASHGSLEHQLFDCNYIYTRAIRFYFGGRLLMYARSVMPKNANAIYKKRFRNLKAQPLGSMLFACSRICRSEFEVAKIYPQAKEYHLATKSHQRQLPYLWARRSTFGIDSPMLSLMEVFSPDLIELVKEYEKISGE